MIERIELLLLNLYCAKLKVTVRSARERAYLSYTNPDAFFLNLQRVQISYCDITSAVVKSLLTNAPFLRSMTIGSNVEMTDGDMFSACRRLSMVTANETSPLEEPNIAEGVE
ncbi:hypothetical protein HUJ05_011504 [Dendroctonus ponderosae]|nr:hypothetical protein HUJ05_011504 [Dendroctonus ponderosae]